MKILNYLGDFDENFRTILKDMLPFFVMMACLRYLGFVWLAWLFVVLAIYLTIRDFEYNELKRQHKKLLTEQAILNEQLEILKRLKDDKPT